jgi:hypothetical protein
MHAVPNRHLGPALGTESFLAYVQRFDIIPQINPSFSARPGPFPDPATAMYLLRRSTRADGCRLGDVVPLDQVRAPLDLIPNFGAKVDNRLTKETSMEYSQEFWLNKYFDKETFFSFQQ